MGEARQRSQPVLQCIYCGAQDALTDEHVLPYAIGGRLVLRKASCPPCAKTTAALEQRLLRGHWWAYRRQLGLESRRPHEQPSDFPATLRTSSGETVAVRVAAEAYPFVLIFDFDPPGLPSGEARTDMPCAARVFSKLLGRLPGSVLVDGVARPLTPDDKLEFPIKLEASDVARFLAKVALAYAVHRRGLHALQEVFLRGIILGDVRGALAYVGCDHRPTAASRVPPHGLHGLAVHVEGDLLSVYMQLFRDKGPPMPIYHVLVGRLVAGHELSMHGPR